MRPTSNGQRWLLASLCWYSSSAILHFLNLHFALYSRLNHFFWVVFGPPESVYSFRNLILPRLIVVTILSIPPAIVGLFVYESKIVWQHAILAWICWSGTFLVIWCLLFCISPQLFIVISGLVSVIFGSSGNGTSFGEYYLDFAVAFTLAAGPSALLGLFIYKDLLRRLVE